jgi:hypothetical protein
MELPKTKSIELIHRRLDKLTKSITDLDKANAQTATLEADLVRLRVVETDLIGDDSTKPAELVQHKARIDLLAGKLRPSTAGGTGRRRDRGHGR